MAEVKSDKKGIHLIDKSLEEIIRVKGIENPYSRKRKKQSPPNRKSPRKNSYSQKRLKTEDLRNRIGTKCSVMISGLAKGVTRGDLEELFRPFAKGGNLSVKLHFNSNGFFNGSAEVDLPTREQALRAAETYNNVDLDDSTMTVIVTNNLSKNQNDEPGCSKNFDQSIKKQTFKESGSKSESQAKQVPYFYQRNKNGPKETPKIEDLDAEMEEYMGKNPRQFRSI